MASLERWASLDQWPAGPGLKARTSNTVGALLLLLIFGPLGVLGLHEGFRFLKDMLHKRLPENFGFAAILALAILICATVSVISISKLVKHFFGENAKLVALGYSRRSLGFRYLSQGHTPAICIDLGSDRRPCQISVQISAKVQGRFRFCPDESQLIETLQQEGTEGLWSQMIDEDVLGVLAPACTWVTLEDGWLTLRCFGAWPGGSLEGTEALLTELANRAELRGSMRIFAIQDAALGPQPMSSLAIQALANLNALDALEECAFFAPEAPPATRMAALQAFAFQAEDERLLAHVNAALNRPSEARLLELLRTEQDPFTQLLVVWGLGLLSLGKAVGPLRRARSQLGGLVAVAARCALRSIQSRLPNDLQAGAMSFSERDDGQLSIAPHGKLSVAPR